MSAGTQVLYGCLLPLIAIGACFGGCAACYSAPQSWEFSWIGWRIAPETAREAMARDYLSRLSAGGTLQQVLDDLGDPDWSSGKWMYAMSSMGLTADQASYEYEEPALLFWFKRAKVSGYWRVELEPCAAVPEFDAALWRSFEAAPERRLPLAHALVEGRHLLGATTQEVRDALGPPDYGVVRLEYVIGWEDSSDHAFLVTTFDGGDRLIDAQLEGVD